MHLFYFALPQKNFGDDLNLWLWDDLIPGWRNWQEDAHLIGVGTVLSKEILPKGPKLVLGSGAGYGNLPEINGTEWDIRALRGPITCKSLGLPQELAMSDPAIMLPLLRRFADVAPGTETLFVPHHSSDKSVDWASLCSPLGIAYQSPSADAEHVIRRIASAKRVIAESMHAAIIADAFGVPWCATELSADFNRRKWSDWTQSLGMDTPEFYVFYKNLRRLQKLMRSIKSALPGKKPTNRPTPATTDTARPKLHLPPVPKPKPYLTPFAKTDLRRVLYQNHFQLTDRARLAHAQVRFSEMLEKVAKDYS